MLVVTGYHPGDQDQAIRQAEWLLELGGAHGHQLILIADTRCAGEVVERLHRTFEKSYDQVKTLQFTDHLRKWPDAPNRVFAMAADHVSENQRCPWFFCEPDLVFLAPNAITLLEDEYRRLGALFLGDKITAANSGINVVDHCSGNAVYPANVYDHAGLAMIAGDLAFDVAAAEQIVPRMAVSELIVHRWKHAPFESWEQVDRDIFAKKPKAVLFHADKTGSLINLLRQKRNEIPTQEGAPDAASEGVLEANPIGVSNKSSKIGTQTATQPALSTSCDIFVKTWEGDYCWMPYLLRSIDKFCSGFRKVVIVAPDDKCPRPQHAHSMIVEPDGDGDGYKWQGVVKALAHHYSDADMFLHIDSDCIFTKPCSPETFFRDGKPFWLYSPYAKTETPWQPITEKFMQRSVPNEYMRRMPMFVPRIVHAGTELFCRETHGKDIAEYVREQPFREWSEFNAMGAVAFERFHDLITWVNCHP